MKPTIETDQIVTNLKKIINELAKEKDTSSLVRKVIKLPSVIPTPPGKKEKMPKSIEE